MAEKRPPVEGKQRGRRIALVEMKCEHNGRTLQQRQVLCPIQNNLKGTVRWLHLVSGNGIHELGRETTRQNAAQSILVTVGPVWNGRKADGVQHEGIVRNKHRRVLEAKEVLGVGLRSATAGEYQLGGSKQQF